MSHNHVTISELIKEYKENFRILRSIGKTRCLHLQIYCHGYKLVGIKCVLVFLQV